MRYNIRNGSGYSNYWPTRINTWILRKLTTRMYFNIFIIIPRIILPLTPMRSLRSDLIFLCSCLRRGSTLRGVLCSLATRDKTHRNVTKLQRGRLGLVIRKNLSTVRVVKEWNMLGLRWLIPNGCLCSRDIWKMPSVIRFNFWFPCRGHAAGLDNVWRPLPAVLFSSVLFCSVLFCSTKCDLHRTIGQDRSCLNHSTESTKNKDCLKSLYMYSRYLTKHY